MWTCRMYVWLCAVIISLMVYSMDRNDWLSLYLPSSRFFIGVVFLVHMASLIHLAFLLRYLAITFAPLNLWCNCFCLHGLSFQTYALPSLTLFFSRGNRLVVMFSTSFLCSASLVLVLPVSPMCAWLQLLRRIWYKQSLFLLVLFWCFDEASQLCGLCVSSSDMQFHCSILRSYRRCVQERHGVIALFFICELYAAYSIYVISFIYKQGEYAIGFL